MLNDKELINKEIEKLSSLLDQTLRQMKKISKLYSYIYEMEGVEKDQLKKLISLCDESMGVGDEIYRLRGQIRYFTRPREEGTLFLAANERYRLKHGDEDGEFDFVCEFTSGSTIEVYLYDDFDGEYRWIFGRVEHDVKMGGYYLMGDGRHRLEPGMKAAIRN